MPTIDKRAVMALAVLAAVTFFGSQMNQYRFGLGLSRLFLIGLSAGCGLALGWFCSPAAKRLRRVLLLGLGGLALFIAFAGPSGIADATAWLLAMIGFWLGLGYWLGDAARGFFAKPDTFGSAEWASADYLRAHELVGDDGIRIGTFSTGGGEALPLHYTGDRHVLLIAPTRSGKGTTFIVPNLLARTDRSAVVIDPKGENALITAHARRQAGQEIHIVDPWGIAREAGAASRFNPLDWLVPGDIDITENAMLLADALVVPDQQGDSFWAEEAKALLQGLILYVATDEHEAENRHLGRVRDLLLLDGEDMPQLFQRMAQSVHHVVASTGSRSLQKEEKLLANVIASAQAQTHFLDSPRVRESLSASDFRFEDLKTRSMTVYLVLPVDRLTAFGRWLRLLIQQAITVNARSIEIQPAKPVLFILDEMPALGRLAMVDQAFRLMAGFGLQLVAVAQDASKLRELFGEGWQGFAANSGLTLYHGSRDQMTAEFFSALCGVATAWNFSSAVSRSFSSSASGSSSSTGTSENYAWTQRKLAFPDELMRLPQGRQLIFVENHHPIAANRERWFNDPALERLGRNLRKEIK